MENTVPFLYLAESIRDSLFSFNDLAELSDTTLRIILQKTDQYPWAIAMKGCNEKLRQRILSTMSAAMADALKSELDAIGPLRLSEISAVQHQIAEKVLMLEAEGDIEVKRTSPPREQSLASPDRLRNRISTNTVP